MKCAEIQELLTSYLLSDLDPARSADVRAHLQTCAACRASADELQATLLVLREGLAETSSLPTRLPEKFILQFQKRRWRRPRIAKPKPASRPWWVHLSQWAAVAAILVLLAGLMIPSFMRARYTSPENARMNEIRAYCTLVEPQQAASMPSAQSEATYGAPRVRVTGGIADESVSRYENQLSGGIGISLGIMDDKGKSVNRLDLASKSSPAESGKEKKTRSSVFGFDDSIRAMVGGATEELGGESGSSGTAGGSEGDSLQKLKDIKPSEPSATAPGPTPADYSVMVGRKAFLEKHEAERSKANIYLPKAPASKKAGEDLAYSKEAKDHDGDGRITAEYAEGKAQPPAAVGQVVQVAKTTPDDWENREGDEEGKLEDISASLANQASVRQAERQPGAGVLRSPGRSAPAKPGAASASSAARQAQHQGQQTAQAAQRSEGGGGGKGGAAADRSDKLVYDRELAAISSAAEREREPAKLGEPGVQQLASQISVTPPQPSAPAALPMIGDIPINGMLFADKVGTDIGAQNTKAETKRLAAVRDFQSGGKVSGGVVRSVGTVTNTVAPPEPAVSNAPPVNVPVCRATGVNPFVSATDKPFSTFSIDVDTASYTLSRNYILRGLLPPPEAVRTEEFVNYFDYDYAPPAGPTFAVYTDCGPSAFGRGLSLLKIGVKGRRLGREEKRPAILTLLIDTSGSMATPDRIELVKSALIQMVERLDKADKVAIVQYDSHARLLLEHTPASDKKKILTVIEGLQTSGSTSLEEGMRAAYAAAARGFNSGGCNRVLLLSDGMANLGSTAAEDILKSIESYRKQGITLSVFGFGLGAYNDVMLETLANKGDGVYAFIDSESEAKRTLVDDLAATVNLIARDVKIQVEFNPKRVKQYRQLGYENRQLKKEQFRDDSVDAGEIGSGQSVTALYELELQGDAREPLGMVRVRCRNALTAQIEEIEQPIQPPAGATPFEAMDVRFRLAAAAAEFSEILRGSPFAAGRQFEDVARVLRPVALELSLDNRIQEFLRLTQTGLAPKFQDAGNP